eukprot:14574522-Alexandrium_andersonii.AAC.1
MSASLVGSEMCIRDRTSPPAASSLGPGPLLPFFAEPFGLGPAERGRDSCLLYTSDAADDM